MKGSELIEGTWILDDVGERLYLEGLIGGDYMREGDKQPDMVEVDLTVRWDAGCPYAVTVVPVKALKRFIEEYEKKYGTI